MSDYVALGVNGASLRVNNIATVCVHYLDVHNRYEPIYVQLVTYAVWPPGLFLQNM